MSTGEGLGILMIGPQHETGGVSTHTKALIGEFRGMGHSVSTFNTLTKKGWRPGQHDPSTLLDHVVKTIRLATLMPLEIFRKRGEVDLVHIQSSGPIGGFLPAIFGTFFTRVMGLPTLVTFHYSKTDEFVKDHPGSLSGVVGRCDRFIVVSFKQKKFIEGVVGEGSSEKIIRIPNGFNRENFPLMDKSSARRSLGIDEDTVVLVNIAWIMEKKGHIHLIDALEDLSRDSNRKVKCFVIGKGPMLEELRSKVTEKGLDGIIEFTGFMPQDEMVKLFNASDMFVLPSLSEGNPIVMFEALGLGKPYVGTDVGGVGEIINDPSYGLLCRPGDPKALRSIIERGMDVEWDGKAIKRYSENFTWTRIAKQTEKLYREVLDDKGGID